MSDTNDSPPGRAHFAKLATEFMAHRHNGDRYFVNEDDEWFAFLFTTGRVPRAVLRALVPDACPALKPPSDEEKKALRILAEGPLLGTDFAARLSMEATGGGFKRKLLVWTQRGFIFASAVGYDLTEYGRWVYDAHAG